MNIINLTPHVLNLENEDGVIVTIETSGSIARVGESRQQLPPVGGFKVGTVEYGEVENLPDPQPDTIYIVSALVMQRVPERNDVFAPGELLRSTDGKVIGARGLSAPNRNIVEVPITSLLELNASSEGWGWLSAAVATIERGDSTFFRNLTQEEMAIAKRVYAYLDARTPKPVVIETPANVIISQERRIMAQLLKITVTLIDEVSGDSRYRVFSVTREDEVSPLDKINFCITSLKEAYLPQ